jgi:catechol 2,3-dioxygenase-like lactoylglutathione lyase family enzyme
MIDHVILTVSNFERSVTFYSKALKPLGITLSMEYKGEGNHLDLKGFGDGKSIFFWLKEGKVDPNGVHIGICSERSCGPTELRLSE